MTDEEIETKQKDKLVSLKVSKKKEILKAELVGDLVQTEWDQAEGKTSSLRCSSEPCERKLFC